ncbi:TIR domain-containing protein [Lysinibacillus sp. NPDC056959]|uniref:TIR domain-containing protein n=1 Tax=Lysinibacillus sp. NPDC056959 TaxID=3345981 RepID=UPI003640D5B6
MDYNRKKELINNLIEQMQNTLYDSPHLSILLTKGEEVLTNVFGKNSSHTKNFKNALEVETNYDSFPHSFEIGKRKILIVLDVALQEIELDELFPSTPTLSLDTEIAEPTKSNKVFIVHGHDNGLKNEVARFVERLGLEAVILHEQANAGNTIIEKIENNSDVGFAIVLYTPCDEGKSKSSEQLRSRARQNVVFEHGFFIAKLGRSNVVALHKGEDLELPNDISGVVYIKYEDGAWKYEIAKEMVATGYNVDYMKI